MEKLLTLAEAAEFIGLSPRTLYRLGDAGPRRIRISERRIAFRPEDIAAWIAARAEQKRAA
jgi:predicted DNA-binding transcriptional regulator AlpA